jgi:hypothetical protein
VGQFLDRDGKIKLPLREQFLRNIDRMNVDRLWEVFLPAYRVSAPIGIFYDHCGIAT